MSTIKIAIGLPAYRGRIATQHAAMWLSVGRFAAISETTYDIAMFTVDCNGVDRARNYLIAQAMANGYDWLLMLDDDTWVEGDNPGHRLISMMASGFLENNAAIVGAAVQRRGADGLNVYRLIDNQYAMIKTVGLPSAFYDVDAIGAACMAINLSRIGDAVFEFTDERSEDLEFCRQVKRSGGTILVDTRVKTAHVGNAPVLRS